jgi:hypothetical protein
VRSALLALALAAVAPAWDVDAVERLYHEIPIAT